MSHSFRRKARLPLQSSSALSVCSSGPSLLFLSSVVFCVFLSSLAFFHRVPFFFCLICLCTFYFYFRWTQNRRTTACGEPPSQRLRATLTYSSLLTAQVMTLFQETNVILICTRSRTVAISYSHCFLSAWQVPGRQASSGHADYHERVCPDSIRPICEVAEIFRRGSAGIRRKRHECRSRTRRRRL